APLSATIVITPVNDAPSFVKGADVTIVEDAGAQSLVNWATLVRAGPPNESAQQLTFAITSNTNAALFAAAPAVAANGTLTFTPATDANGSATITLALHDDGGTSNGGLDASPLQSFTISVTAVNDVPSYTLGASPSVAEDSAPQSMASFATAISPGPADEAAQTISFALTNDNNPLFSAQPAIAADGTLTFTPAPDANGIATVTVVAGDSAGANAAPRTFTIMVTPVNDAPSFVKGADPASNEDAGPQALANWATAINAGPANESAQTIAFVTTGNTNPSLFSAPPSVASNGTLTYTSAPNANGSANITLVAQDDGGGTNTSAPQSFTITINALNDAPSFVVGANQSANEDSGAHTVPSFLTAISPGPADEAAQTVTFGVANDNNALFAVQPAIDAAGVLTFTTAADAFGSATVSVIGTDSGGASSLPQTFTITIAPVNDAPSFAKGADLASDEDAGPQSIANWATAISAGPANESTQTVSFQITGNTNPSLFSAAPAVSANGTLTYTSALNASGSATITLLAQDDGGGTNTSAPRSFTIAINAVNDAPTVNAATFALNENSANGTPVGTATYSDPDPSQNHAFAITGGNTGGAFAIDATTGAITVASQAALDFETNPSFALTVTVTDDGAPVQSGGATITVQLNDLNEAPTASNASFSVDENSPNGTAIGTVSASDVDAGQTLGYAITSGNAAGVFAISGTTGLITVASSALLDFESTAAYTLGVTVTDSAALPLSATATISITVNNGNDPPTDLALAGNTVAENLPAATAVGTLTTTDQDAADPHTYTLVLGTGSTDNALFQISGNQLQTAAPLDFETKPLASVRIRTIDSGGAFLEKQFAITITDANDPPVALPDSNSATEDAATNTATGDVLLNDTDIDPANPLHVASVSGSAANVGASVAGTYGAVVVNSNGGYTYTLDNALPAVQALAAGQSMPDAFAYAAADPSNATSSSTLTITVHGANDAPAFSSSAATMVDEDSLYTYNVIATDVDTANTLVITATMKPAWLTLVDHGNRTATLSGTPLNGDVGTNDVTLDVFDGTAHVQQSFTIVVANTNDAPIGNDDLFSFTEDSGTYTIPFGTFSVLTNDSDPDIGDSIYVA
ncbi:MAG TPA: Ig-like domain-containing protein, partial [Thermoanaerobaculia bacterium]|nr:Ig-like domain-containing protein [Thermoanaerobaculia bacterium]